MTPSKPAVTPSPSTAEYTLAPLTVKDLPTSHVGVYDKHRRLVARFGGSMTGIVEDTANAKLFAGAQGVAEACLGLLTLLTDDHEDCRSCDRTEDEIAAGGHDPESSCGEAVAALRASGVPVTL